MMIGFGLFMMVLFAISDAVSISLVTSLSAVFMAGISAYFSYKAKVIAETTSKAVDGHLTEFKQMAKASFTAEGVLLEKAEEKARKADALIARAEGIGFGNPGGDVAAVIPVIESTVKQAVVESVPEPVKAAILETQFTDAQIAQIIAALKQKKP